MRTRRWIPAALVLYSAVPVAAGAIRVASLTGGVPELPDTDRFQAMPVPVLLHIVGASLFCVLGAFQFTGRQGRRHRVAGRLLVPLGLAGALSALWLVLFLRHPAGDGALLAGFQIAASTGMAAALVLGLGAIRRRDVTRHRAWMIRGYAIAQGAGTQALIVAPVALTAGQPTGVTRALLLGAGWAVNIAVAEWIIRRTGGTTHESDRAGSVRPAGRVAAGRG
ncbi:MAG TPA: DUF2306 domain-containing protein [Actinophytocola sp.]|uniref:DUF2306 domain-containing protein n=1 Tax=Actinophytocola sp. TaxID=1872138 RepID=UPI002DBD0BF8|nr:DUF2306 domain-containing protein [Actinophytocola sp.]HEU5472479.1 DUF2306 domain-containing protein [Actinophytocola sp.]